MAFLGSRGDDPEETAGRRSLLHWDQIVFFSITRVVLNTMYRMVYPFLPVFSRGLGVDLPRLSAALALRAVAGCFGPLLATLADAFGRKAGIIVGLASFALGTALVGLRPGFTSFVVCLVLTIVGKYVFDPSVQAHIGDRVSYQRRGLVIALTELGWSMSFIAGVPAAGYLMARGDWTSPVLPLSLLALAALGLCFLLIPRDPVRRQLRSSLAANFRLVLTYRPALLGLMTGLLATSANEVINLVFGVWMADSFGLRVAGLGATSTIIGSSELAGELLVGGLTDRMGKRRAVAIGLAMNTLAALALPWSSRGLGWALAGLFCFYITFEFTMVSLLPMMTEILPGARATLLAANVAALSLGRAMGAVIGPALYSGGILANALASGALNAAAWALLRQIPGPARSGSTGSCVSSR
jgi:predicted MFS family arabinose efflux permease